MRHKRKKKNPLKSFNHNWRASWLLSRGIHNSYTDETSERLHTTLTRISKQLRPFIRYEGKQMVSIDIKNAQPRFINQIFQEYFWFPSEEENRINIEELKYKGIIDIKNEVRKNKDIYSMLTVFFKTPMNKDLEDYIHLTQEGEIYEYMMQIMSEKGKELSREKMKKALLIVMYDKNPTFFEMNSELLEVFKSIFPTVYELCYIIKDIAENGLAIILQAIEAELVLNRVTKSINKQHPKLPIFTIHDAIVTTVGNEKTVEQIFKDEVFKALDSTASFSTEYWKIGHEISSQKQLL